MKGAARVVVSGARKKGRLPPKQAVELSPEALRRLKQMLREAPSGTPAFKLGVKSRGCNGLAYTLDYCTQDDIKPDKRQEIVEEDSVKILVEPSALMYVVGTRMDYVEDELRAEFVFENPNATGTCGCGESFNVASVKV